MSEHEAQRTEDVYERLVLENTLLKEKNALLEEQVARLVRDLAHLKKAMRQALFGRSSERDIDGQLGLPFSGELANACAQPIVLAEEAGPEVPPTVSKPAKKSGGRNVIPAHLPRERKICETSKDDLDARFGEGNWKEIGEEVREELDYRPSALFVNEIVVKKYAAVNGSQPPERAAAPKSVIAKGRPGAGLLAHLAVSKYADHLPLYRIGIILKRQGVHIPRSTMCFWLKEISLLVDGIVRTLKAEILASGIVRTDDTGVTMLDSNAAKGSSKTFVWPYMSHDGQIVFDFTESRSRAGPRAFLGDFSGYLQADAAPLYDGIFSKLIIEVACWAHARRRFQKSKDSFPTQANHALALIRALYAVEREAREAKLAPEEVRVLRAQKSRPVLDALSAWIDEEMKTTLPSSQIGDALAYTRRHFGALCTYLEDGRLAIDNNDVEREIRSIAVGRKNYLFFGGANGGRIAANLYTLVANCRLEDINPFEYLRDILARIPYLTSNEADLLTPRRWKAAADSAVAAADSITSSPTSNAPAAN